MAKPYWIIPEKEVLDGSKLALKNADELYKSAKTLLDNKRFVHALSIATLALEEFGKHCIFKEHAMSKSKIDSKFWDNTIKIHEKKLNAIPNHLELYTSQSSEKTVKKELQRYRKYLLKLTRMKLEHLYVDWDSINKKWALVTNSESIKDKAKFAVETAHWTIEKYIEDVQWDRELLFMLHKDMISLFRNKKIHAFCNVCSIVMIATNELLSHKKKFQDHVSKISWHYNT